MKKTISIMLLVIVLFLSFIPVILGKYQDKWNNKSSVTVVLDAGHGGKDGGASSAGGVIEKEIVLSITKKVEDYLKLQGVNVVLTRDGDYDLASKEAKKRKVEDLSKRVQIMNSQENGIVVSIHANAINNSSWSGAQTFYDPKKVENKQLATAIMMSMKNNSTVPSTLVEIGFLSNPAEAEKLGTEEYQDEIAYAIYEGILSYLDNPDMKVE